MHENGEPQDVLVLEDDVPAPTREAIKGGKFDAVLFQALMN